MHPFFVFPRVIAREQRDRGNPYTPCHCEGATRPWQSVSFAMQRIARLAEPQGNGFPGGELPQRGKRGHSGVHQCAHWFGMTEKTSPLYVIVRERRRREPPLCKGRWAKSLVFARRDCKADNPPVENQRFSTAPGAQGGLSKLLLNDLHPTIFSFLRPCYLRF